MRKKQYISFLLAFLMFFSQVSFVFASEFNSAIANTDYNVKTYNEFIEKTGNKYKDGDKLDFVVTLKEDKNELLAAMKNDYSQRKTKPFTKEASTDYLMAERQAKLFEPQISLNPSDEHGVESTVKYNLATQSLFEFALENKGYEFEILNHIDYIFNAVGINTSYETAKEIAKLPYVESVDPSVKYMRVKPVNTEMHTSIGIIKAGDLNKTGYTGKGTVAAVLDTGFWYESGKEIRPEFKDDKLKVEDLKLKKAEAEQLIKEINKNKDEKHSPNATSKSGNAFFINNKIPFAKDYYPSRDEGDRQEIGDYTNDGTSHGTHVSGTIVANGDPAKDPRQIRGVAPEAQILLMQVFNTVGGATGSAFLAEAINDSIKLKADTINMSFSLGKLGDTRSLNDKVLGNAINKATESGVVVAVAAGNYGSSAYPKLQVRSDDFDYGTVRDVASFENSFAVASFNNIKLHTNYLKIVDSGEKVPAYLTDGFATAAFKRGFNRKEEKELEVVDAGIGTDEDFKALEEKGISVQDKAVIMRRHPGALYETKVGNAFKKGALLAIVYNYAGEELQSMGVGNYSDRMPSLFLGKSAGEKIINSHSKIVVGKESIVIDNPNKELMSDFQVGELLLT